MPNRRKWTAAQRKAMSVKLRQKWAVRKSEPVEEPVNKVMYGILNGEMRRFKIVDWPLLVLDDKN